MNRLLANTLLHFFQLDTHIHCTCIFFSIPNRYRLHSLKQCLSAVFYGFFFRLSKRSALSQTIDHFAFLLQFFKSVRRWFFFVSFFSVCAFFSRKIADCQFIFSENISLYSRIQLNIVGREPIEWKKNDNKSIDL